jgi:pumilio family protein 6
MEALLKPVSAAYPSTDQSNPHPIDLSHTSRVYKSLLQGGHFIHSTQTITRSSAFSPLAFASTFVRAVGREITLAMSKGNGAFVVAELCERLKEEGTEEARKAVKEWFRPEDIREIELGKGKGSAVLLEKIQSLY